jgi:uncharacterized protein (TIGR02001 family)
MKYRFLSARCTLPYLLATTLGSSAVMAAPGEAEEAATPWTVPVSIGVVSDYIFRGQSQTWGKPAAQFSLEAQHQLGFYAGFFASNVSKHWLPGARIETDVYGGYRGKLTDDAGYDIGLIYYGYPGANWSNSVFQGANARNQLNTAELYGSVSYKWLAFKAGRTLTEYFGWSTNNSPVNGGFSGDLNSGVTGNTRGSYFAEVNAAYDLGQECSLNGQVGHQTIRNSTGLGITYYKVGVTKNFDGGWNAGAFVSASSNPEAYKRFGSLDNGTSTSNVAKRKFFVTVTKSF